MFSASHQPPILSLFSSTGSDPLMLWTTHTDAALPADSVVCLLQDTSSTPSPPPPAKLISAPTVDPDVEHGRGEGYTLSQTVLHLQSPTLRTTFVQCPPTMEGILGIKHPWIHLQVRNMGREWSFEIGVVDRAGREGVIRCSTFQKTPRLKAATPPILHLPLAFPQPSSHQLTTWSSINLKLPNLLARFTDSSLLEEEEGQSDDDGGHDWAHQPRRARLTGREPSGAYSHVSYVRVYATCRLRRIWFSETGPAQNLPWEFELYSAT